jgi:hypothetical protein
MPVNAQPGDGAAMNVQFFTRQFFLIGVFAACAHAAPILYNIGFSGGSPNPTSGSFTYDASTTQFTSFVVTWDGATFDLTSAANAPAGNGGCTATSAQFFSILTGGPGVCAGTNTIEWDGVVTNPSQASFEIADLGTGAGSPFATIAVQVAGGSHPLAQTSGAFLATAVAPEPPSILLTCGGIALLGLLRRAKTI